MPRYTLLRSEFTFWSFIHHRHLRCHDSQNCTTVNDYRSGIVVASDFTVRTNKLNLIGAQNGTLHYVLDALPRLFHVLVHDQTQQVGWIDIQGFCQGSNSVCLLYTSDAADE